MDDEIAQKFINSVVKNLQVLCHSNVDFNKNVEVIGHLYLNVDSCTKLNYIVNEKVCKNEASSTVFVSNSFHAEVGLKKKEKEPVNKSVDEVAQRLQRSHHSHHSHPRDDYSRRHSIDSNSTSQKREREHHGHSFHMEPKIPRLSDPMESRQSSSIHSPNSRNKHSHENSASSTLHKQQILEVDLAKVKKEFISGGGCGMEGGNNEESSTCRSNTGPFLNEPDVPSVDFSTAFPISIHQNQNLAAALNIPEISGSSNSNNNTSAASSIDQKPFAHNSSIEPPQFPPMMAGGSPRLRPPWMGEHSVNPSAASSNFPDDLSSLNIRLHTLHSKTYVGGKSYSCTICGKSYTSNQNLEGHMNKHANIRPHICTFCGTSFNYLYALRRHLKTKCRRYIL